MNNENNNTAADDIFGAPIYTYTRAEAVADGFQVAIDSKTAREAGFTIPVYMNRTVFAQYVEIPAGVEGQDVEGRLWDILHMLRVGIARSRSNGARLEFQLYVRNDNRRPRLVTLAAEIGARDIDDASPAMTIMLPSED